MTLLLSLRLSAFARNNHIPIFQPVILTVIINIIKYLDIIGGNRMVFEFRQNITGNIYHSILIHF
jgi:hypothetical protein